MAHGIDHPVCPVPNDSATQSWSHLLDWRVVLRSYDDERASRVHRGLVLRRERMNDWIVTENYSSVQAVIAHRLQRWSKARFHNASNAAQCTGQTQRTFHVRELHVRVHSSKLRKDSTAIEVSRRRHCQFSSCF